MITVYHNPRCSKSRLALKYLEDKNQSYEVVEYLKNPLTKQQLSDLLSLLSIQPIELVRKNEKIWKEEYKGKELNDEQLIEAMIENPKLIERPIVVANNKATIARPTEKIDELF